MWEQKAHFGCTEITIQMIRKPNIQTTSSRMMTIENAKSSVAGVFLYGSTEFACVSFSDLAVRKEFRSLSASRLHFETDTSVSTSRSSMRVWYTFHNELSMETHDALALMESVSSWMNAWDDRKLFLSDKTVVCRTKINLKVFNQLATIDNRSNDQIRVLKINQMKLKTQAENESEHGACCAGQKAMCSFC